MFKLNFRLLAHKDKALRSAPRILRAEFRSGLRAVGKKLVTSSRARMRKDTGRTQKSLRMLVSGTGVSLNVTVYSVLVQAFVDAYGLKRGVFPPHHVGSRLYQWAKRKQAGKQSKEVFIGGRVTVKRRPRRIDSVRRVRTSVRGATPTRKARAKARDNDTARMAYAVARKIYKHGIKPTAWNKRALKANERVIVQQMRNALKRAVVKMKRA